MNQLSRFLALIAMMGHSPCIGQPLCPPKIQWQQSFGGSGSEIGFGLLPLVDGGYIMSTLSDSDPSGNKTSPHFGDNDFWIVRFDAEGNIIWQNSFGGTGPEYQAWIVPAGDGEFLVGGASSSGADGNKTTVYNGCNATWLVRLDRDGNKLWDRAYEAQCGAPISFAPTTDGGFVLDILSYSPTNDLEYGGKLQISILRLDSAGNELWTRDFGGMEDEIPFDIHQTKDGGFIFDAVSRSSPSGNKTSPHYGGEDIWVVRLDANGNKLWENSFGGTGDDSPGNIQETPNGDFIVAGLSSSPADGNKTSARKGGNDSWLLRLDAHGNKIFEQTYGGSSDEYLGGLLQMQDGGLLMFGTSASRDGDRSGPFYGDWDYWMLRLDANGKKLWDMSLGGSGIDFGFNLQPTLDGGFIFGGYSSSTESGNKTSPLYGAEDYWVIKLGPEQICDSDGDSVPDDLDLCPGTSAGEMVDEHGCSLEQLAPCAGSWKNHGQYMQAVEDAARKFLSGGLITLPQKERAVAEAARSDCGKAAAPK